MKYTERECICQIGSLQILTSEKMHSTVKRMVPASVLRNNYSSYLLLKELQWMTASSPVKINIVVFKEWMNAILTVIKTDTLIQGSDDCN